MSSKIFSFIFINLLVLAGGTAIAETESASVNEKEAYESFVRMESKAPATKDFLNATERQKLFDDVSRNPVTSLENVGKYDPQGIIGFCFGRAMGVHLTARKMGLKPDSIRKLFIVGDLRSGPDPEWRFHVTTLVKGEDGHWWAVDPIFTYPLGEGKSVPMAKWIDTVQKTWDKKDKAYLYVTDAMAVIPDVTKDPNGTGGKNIIELDFDPSKKAGFTAVNVGKKVIYRTDASAIDQHFFTVKTPDKNNAFQFLGLTIGSEVISYRNYFVELIASVSKRVRSMVVPQAVVQQKTQAPEKCVKALGAVGASKSLHSMRLFEIWKK